MTAPTPGQVRRALVDAGLTVQLVPGWDDPAIGKYGSGWSPSGVVLHHTANSGAPGDAPSLAWVVHNKYAPVRACHLLIARSGLVHLVYALGCYHAGMGGPMKVAGTSIPKDAGNRYLYGIEVESKGTDPSVTAGAHEADGFTPAQVEATARAAAALVRLLGRDESAVIRHRDWAPHRKSDVLQPLPWWRAQVSAHLAAPHPPPLPPTIPPTHPVPDPHPGTTTPEDRTMVIRFQDAAGGSTLWLLAGGRLTSLPRKAAATWTGDTLTITDPATWARLRAAYPVT